MILIDANNLFYANYVVNPSVAKNGEPCGGIIGFLKSLGKICRETDPDKIIICWDGENNSKKRKQINENYKKGRKKLKLNRISHNLTDEQNEQNKIQQMIELMSLLNLLPVVQIMIKNLEADDVIAYLNNLNKDCQKIIISNDKDFYQLLDENTIIYRPSQKDMFNVFDIVENYNVHPNNFCLARCLIGDLSDKLPGVKGVGFKTLTKSFPEFSERKKIILRDIYKKCEQELKTNKKPLKIFENILNSKSLIEDNYIIMQLEHVNISLQNKNLIENLYNVNKFAYKKIEFIQRLRDGGYLDNSKFIFDNLLDFFRIYVNKNSH